MVKDTEESTGPKYKGIIFDLDQTLANTEDFFAPSTADLNGKNYEKYSEWKVYQYLKPYLKIVSWDKFIKFYLESREQVKQLLKGTAASHNRYLYIKKTLENLGLRFTPKLVLEATNVYWNNVYDNMKLFPGVERTLELAKQFNLKTCVVTDLTADIQIKKLEALKIERFVDFVITSEETLADKPSPKSILMAIQKMELKPEEVILIGNNPKTDIASAENARIDSVLFDYNGKYENSKDSYKCSYIRDFSKFAQILGVEDHIYSDQKLVVFDLMGTLTTEGHLVKVILSEVISKYGKATPEKISETYERYKVAEIDDAEFWEEVGVTKIADAEREMLKKVEPFPGVNEMLVELKKIVKIAILSNLPARWGDLITDKFDFETAFDEIIYSGDYKMKKPDPRLYHVLLEKFVVINPSNMYVVDNELGDLEPAKDQLMTTVWLKDRDEGVNYIPDYVIEKIGDVVGVIHGK